MVSVSISVPYLGVIIRSFLTRKITFCVCQDLNHYNTHFHWGAGRAQSWGMCWSRCGRGDAGTEAGMERDTPYHHCQSLPQCGGSIWDLQCSPDNLTISNSHGPLNSHACSGHNSLPLIKM